MNNYCIKTAMFKFSQLLDTGYSFRVGQIYRLFSLIEIILGNYQKV